jgi:hypothetical protein
MSSEADKDTVEPDDLNVGLIATVAVVGALLVLAIALTITALVRSESASYGDEIGTFANLGEVARMKAEQRAKLEAAPAWADKAKGQVTLPIDRAMALVTGEIAKNPYRATVTPPPPPVAPEPSAAPPVEGAPAGAAAVQATGAAPSAPPTPPKPATGAAPAAPPALEKK